MSRDSNKGWLDHPRNVTRLYYGLLVICVLLVLVDPLYDKHPHFGWEGWFGFQGWLGFAAFFLIVLSGYPLRRLLSRDEDYYDR